MKSLARLIRNRSGSSAVEFAIIAPIFIAILFSLIAYGIYLSAVHAVQQVAADAARTAVAGLNSHERETLAKDFVNQSKLDYVFLNKNNFSVNVGVDPSNPNQLTVTVEYDASGLPIWNLYTYALPEKSIKRFSTVRIGGI